MVDFFKDGVEAVAVLIFQAVLVGEISLPEHI